MSMGADTKPNTWGGGALERCHGAFLEPFAQLGDALCSVGATAAFIEAAELVVGQAAKGRRCQWALTQKPALTLFEANTAKEGAWNKDRH